MKCKWAAISLLLTVSCILLTTPAIRADISGKKTQRFTNLDQMRALEALSRKERSKSPFTGDRAINANLKMLSETPFMEENWVLPFTNSARIAKRIDMLLQEYEKSGDTESAQITQFNIAYEYFLFYLSFLRESYLLGFQKENADIIEIDLNQLISDEELSQYLLQAQLYLQGLTSAPDNLDNSRSGGDRTPYWSGKTKSASFMVRDNTALYMNANFLAFLIECEKLAGRFRLSVSGNNAEESVDDLDMPSEKAIRHYDRITWDWLNELWKRYQFQIDNPAGRQRPSNTLLQTDTAGFSTYCPSTNTLFYLYKIYLSYNFMWRYLTDTQENSPYLNSLTRVILQRLSKLHRNASGSSAPETYDYYHVESAKDAGQTNFLPALFFARRGYFMAHDITKAVIPRELFDLYGSFYQEAAAKISNNIAYRSRLYNERILLGAALDNLHLMENTLYDYALRSIRIESPNDYNGREFARSARLTAAVLLADILETKSMSGLYEGCERYRDLGNALSPLLISPDNNNWQYASTIHSSLARFYSQEEYFDEALSMYHAKQAFLIPCEKVAITYGNQWQQFFQMPGHEQALSVLKLFLYFHNKYSTNPEALIPKTFNANKIVQAWITAEKSNFINPEGEF